MNQKTNAQSSSGNVLNIANAGALLPIQGVCYTPTPSDDTPSPPQKYFDSDFTNSDFPLLWGTANGGRGDINTLSSGVGVNFVHLYNWSVPPAPGQQPGQYQRSHLSFLAECAANNVKVFVPISNYFLEQLHQGNTATVTAQVTAMVTEIYNGGTTPNPGAGIWGIGNEYDLAGGLFTVTDVVNMIAILLAAETSLNIPAQALLPITVPVSFADPTGANTPAIVALQNLQTALAANPATANVWTSRFIASMNPFNDGAYLANYISTTFPNAFPNTPFFFTEMGTAIQAGTPVTTEAQQAAYVQAQLLSARAQGNFMGACVFQNLDQSAVKSGSEATFGMTKYATPPSCTTGTIPAGYVPGGGDTYNVDVLTQKPLYQSVQGVYMGTIQANRTWHNTNVNVDPSTPVTISCTGGAWTADPHDNNGQLYSAGGDPTIIVTQPGYPLMGVAMGALVGRVGSQVFLVGMGTTLPATASGVLELCINDDLNHVYGSGLADNIGGVFVTIG